MGIWEQLENLKEFYHLNSIEPEKEISMKKVLEHKMAIMYRIEYRRDSLKFKKVKFMQVDLA